VVLLPEGTRVVQSPGGRMIAVAAAAEQHAATSDTPAPEGTSS
jgi:hypothetical protein